MRVEFLYLCAAGFYEFIAPGLVGLFCEGAFLECYGKPYLFAEDVFR